MSKYGILLLCGLPAAGKSTLAKYLQEINSLHLKTENDKAMFVVLNYDDFIDENLDLTKENSGNQSGWKNHRMAVLVGFQKVLEEISPFVSNEESRYDQQLLEEITCKVKSNLMSVVSQYRQLSMERFVFVIDDNLFYRSMRYQYFQLARRYSIGFCEVAVHIDVNAALERNKTRQKPISNTSILKMHNIFEFPDAENYSWEKHSLHVSFSSLSSNITHDSISNLVCEAMKNPEQPIDYTEEIESRKICFENVFYQADQVMRKEIGHQIKEYQTNQNCGKVVSELAKKLNLQRKLVLKKLKTDINVLTELKTLYKVNENTATLNIDIELKSKFDELIIAMFIQSTI